MEIADKSNKSPGSSILLEKYFDKNQKGMEFGSNVGQETSISSKPFNVTLIASVNKDWSTISPVLLINQILLVKTIGTLWSEGEMI